MCVHSVEYNVSQKLVDQAIIPVRLTMNIISDISIEDNGKKKRYICTDCFVL